MNLPSIYINLQQDERLQIMRGAVKAKDVTLTTDETALECHSRNMPNCFRIRKTRCSDSLEKLGVIQDREKPALSSVGLVFGHLFFQDTQCIF